MNIAQRKKAFTLVEVLTVVIVVTIMFVLLVAYVDFASDDAKFDVAEADYLAIDNAIVSAVYQNSMQGDGVLTTNLDTLKKQINAFLEPKYFFTKSGSYLICSTEDPFGGDYIIKIITGASPSDTVWEFSHAHKSRDAVSNYMLETGSSTKRLLVNGVPINSPVHNANSQKLPSVGRDLNEYTWEEIIEIFDAGLGDVYFDIGDTKVLDIGEDTDGDGTLDTVTVALVGFNHDNRADGAGKAGGSFLVVSSNMSYHMHGTTSVTVSWNETDIRIWLRNVVYNALPYTLQNNIVTVVKTFDDHKLGTLNTVNDSLWLASADEIDINGALITKSGQGTTYEYFESAGVAFNGSVDASWWTRSGRHTASGRDLGYFVAAKESLHDQGSDVSFYPTDMAFVAFGFCIGQEQTLEPTT